MPHAGEVLWLLGKLQRGSEKLTQATSGTTKQGTERVLKQHVTRGAMAYTVQSNTLLKNIKNSDSSVLQTHIFEINVEYFIESLRPALRLVHFINVNKIKQTTLYYCHADILQYSELIFFEVPPLEQGG